MPSDPAPLWTQASSLLRARLNTDAYRRWIAPLKPLDLSDDTLTLAVANDFFQSWLQDNYLPLIRMTLGEAAGRPVQVRFAAAPQPSGAQDSASVSQDASVTPPRERKDVPSDLNPNYTFETFVVGQNNQWAHAAALAVAQSPGRAYNPLFIYGGTGLGKTHLMQALGHHLRRSSQGLRVVYMAAEKFTNEFIHAIQTNGLVRFRKKFRASGALLIDDIQFLAGKERSQEEFFHTFNQIYDARNQLVLSSDRPAAEMKGLEARLVSRFEWGSVTELLPPDLETRIAILRKKAGAQQLSVSDEIITFLAEKIRTNIRRLEGALIRIASFASLTGRQPSPADLEHLLRDILLEETRQAVTIPLIQQRVVAHFDILLSDMTSKRRPREIAFARQVAMFLSRQLTQCSLSEIGAAFGGRDHGTVLYACRLIQTRVAKDAGLRQTVAFLSKQLGR